MLKLDRLFQSPLLARSRWHGYYTIRLIGNFSSACCKLCDCHSSSSWSPPMDGWLGSRKWRQLGWFCSLHSRQATPLKPIQWARVWLNSEQKQKHSDWDCRQYSIFKITAHFRAFEFSLTLTPHSLESDWLYWLRLSMRQILYKHLEIAAAAHYIAKFNSTCTLIRLR